MHFVDDDGLYVGQRFAGCGGQHQKQRLGCGDEDVRRSPDEFAALCRRGVSGTHAHGDGGRVRTIAFGDPRDARKRCTQVAFDVDRQGFERRDVEHPGAGGGYFARLVYRPQECREGLARTGRCDHQGVLTVGDRRPGLLLGRCGCGEGAGEPLPGCRREPVQRVDVHPCSLPGGTPMPRACVSVRRHAVRPGSSRTLVAVGLVNRGEVHPDVPGTAEHLVVPIRRRVDDQFR